MAEEIILFDHLPEVIRALHKVATMKAQETALAIAKDAAENHPWQNETGQAESTFYVVMQNFSTYGLGFVEGGKSDMEAEVDAPTDDQTAYISNASSYYPFLELGTSRMPAFPALGPAAEANRSKFESGDGWEEALIQLVGL